jgi:hypothetical protein
MPRVEQGCGQVAGPAQARLRRQERWARVRVVSEGTRGVPHELKRRASSSAKQGRRYMPSHSSAPPTVPLSPAVLRCWLSECVTSSRRPDATPQWSVQVDATSPRRSLGAFFHPTDQALVAQQVSAPHTQNPTARRARTAAMPAPSRSSGSNVDSVTSSIRSDGKLQGAAAAMQLSTTPPPP